MTPSRRAFLPSVLEDSLDAATALTRSWERALVSPRFTIAGVAQGPERRLLANLRCLSVRDTAIAEELLLPALGDDGDPQRAFVAALALLEGGGPALPALLAKLGAGASARPILRALALTGNRAVEADVRRVVEEERGDLRLAMALEVLALRRVDARVDLRALVAGGPPEVARASLWVAHGSAPGMFSCNVAESMLEATDAAVRDAAIEVALTHGSKLAWQAARDAADSGKGVSEVVLLALATSGDAEDTLRLVRLVGTEAHREAALGALGFAGDRRGLEVCLAAMEERGLARVAGESFAAVTGLKMTDAYAEDEEGKAPGGSVLPALEDDDLDANLVPGPETELPLPEVGAVKRWWASNSGRFAVDLRYLGGAPLDGRTLLEAFRNGPARRRRALGLELAIRTRAAWRVDVTQWARTQLVMQGSDVGPVDMSTFGALLE